MAAKTGGASGAVPARPMGSGWESWLESRAAGAGRPVRLFVLAELGYRRWRPWAKRGRHHRRGPKPAMRHRLAAGAAEVRRDLAKVAVVGPDGQVRHYRHLSVSPHVQLRWARRSGTAAALIAILGIGTSASAHLRDTGPTVAFEQLIVGGRVQAEALASVVGTEAARAVVGVATDAVGLVLPSASAEPPAPPPAPTVPTLRGALPVGKGMWIWLAEQAEGGNPDAIVARAKEIGLTHLYVRTASLSQGFYAGPFLDRLLPLAHAASIRVYAWDFPYLDNVDADVSRALQAITYTTPDGHRVDGYAADVELPSMGVNITAATGKHFGVALRRAVGPNYPLIACVPRPNPSLTRYPFADLVAAFDAIAPMVYWLGADPVRHIAGAIRDLGVYGKPILPVGQAYDGAGEGGPRGVPSREELIDFMRTGDQLGATGVSWWSWQHADQEAWHAIRDAAEFRLPVGDPAGYTVGQIKAYQTLLTSLGFQAPIDGVWGETTAAAVRAYQQAAQLAPTGAVDDPTLKALLTPFAPPIQPQS